MALTFRVQVLCIRHPKPRVVDVVRFKSMDAVFELFNDFGRLWHGSCCVEHSALSLIPRFDGYEVAR